MMTIIIYNLQLHGEMEIIFGNKFRMQRLIDSDTLIRVFNSLPFRRNRITSAASG